MDFWLLGEFLRSVQGPRGRSALGPGAPGGDAGPGAPRADVGPGARHRSGERVPSSNTLRRKTSRGGGTVGLRLPRQVPGGRGCVAQTWSPGTSWLAVSPSASHPACLLLPSDSSLIISFFFFFFKFYFYLSVVLCMVKLGETGKRRVEWVLPSSARGAVWSSPREPWGRAVRWAELSLPCGRAGLRLDAGRKSW